MSSTNLVKQDIDTLKPTLIVPNEVISKASAAAAGHDRFRLNKWLVGLLVAIPLVGTIGYVT